MATRLGVDVGGTFTDLIFYDDETGEVRVARSRRPGGARGRRARRGRRGRAGRALARARYFLHGTTVGLNSLLTRTGAGRRAARDARLPRRARDRARRPRRPVRPFLAAAAAARPARALRLPVTERIRADGEILTRARGGRRARGALAAFAAEGVERSRSRSSTPTRTPPTSSRPRERCARAGFEGEISLSHRVSGEYREYERTSTTVIDAYVRPRMTRYLRALERGSARPASTASAS